MNVKRNRQEMKTEKIHTESHNDREGETLVITVGQILTDSNRTQLS